MATHAKQLSLMTLSMLDTGKYVKHRVTGNFLRKIDQGNWVIKSNDVVQTIGVTKKRRITFFVDMRTAQLVGMASGLTLDEAGVELI